MELSVRTYAYIGDAVYELFAREKTVKITENPAKLHKATSSIVNAQFHADLLEYIQDFLTDSEKEIIRRARNLPVTTARRINQTTHRLSTAFEALIGYLHITDKDRLELLLTYIEPIIKKKLQG